MRLAYVSPLNPIQSGISDFSEELIGALRKHITIDLFCDVSPSAVALRDCNCYHTKELFDKNCSAQYDAIVYHIGNNPEHHKAIVDAALHIPGIVEFHDFSLHVFLANVTLAQGDREGYLSCIRYCHGERGVRMVQKHLEGKAGAPWEEHSLELLANKYLIDAAKGIIVHSDMAKQMVMAIRPNVPIIHIPHHTNDVVENPEQERRVYRKMLNVSEDALVFGSFGFITPAKRITSILQALKLFKQNCIDAFLYYIVGEVEDSSVRREIKNLGLESNVIITGFVSLDEFKQYMGVCNLCINLRYPTQGETSGSLHRLFGMAVPVLVTDIGTFREYPDEFVFKVRYDSHEVEDIYNHLCQHAQSSEKLARSGRAALKFAKTHCDLDKNAEQYTRFFHEVQAGLWREDWMDCLVDKLMEENIADVKSFRAQQLISEAVQQNAQEEIENAKGVS